MAILNHAAFEQSLRNGKPQSNNNFVINDLPLNPEEILPNGNIALKGTNPKDLLGAKKVVFTCVPPVALAHEAFAMMDGSKKYGPFNWRKNKVQARIYIDAALRHMFAWFEGEEYAEDSGAHHLGHARACLGILLDAIETGNLVDDRPIEESKMFLKVLNRLNEEITRKNKL